MKSKISHISKASRSSTEYRELCGYISEHILEAIKDDHLYSIDFPILLDIFQNANIPVHEFKDFITKLQKTHGMKIIQLIPHLKYDTKDAREILNCFSFVPIIHEAFNSDRSLSIIDESQKMVRNLENEVSDLKKRVPNSSKHPTTQNRFIDEFGPFSTAVRKEYFTNSIKAIALNTGSKLAPDPNASLLINSFLNNAFICIAEEASKLAKTKRIAAFGIREIKEVTIMKLMGDVGKLTLYKARGAVT